MNVNKYFLQILVFVVFIGIGCAQASEIYVSSRVVSTPSILGDPALVSVTLSNGAGTSIRNVDLRLAGSEMMIRGNGVLQFGNVDADGISTILAELYPAANDGGMPGSILWRIDYDVVTGNHIQIELSSELSAEE